MWNPFSRKSEPEPYPQMPPYPMSLDDVRAVVASYVRDERPVDFFFEFYIMEVIGVLPSETVAALDDFAKGHPEVFECGEWRSKVRDALHLSETIDVAILDLWFRNREIASERGHEYHPWHFAINFADQYFADDSLVDVWPDGALEAAKARIARHMN